MKIPEALTRKVYGMPVYVWGIAVVGGFVLYKRNAARGEMALTTVEDSTSDIRSARPGAYFPGTPAPGYAPGPPPATGIAPILDPITIPVVISPVPGYPMPELPSPVAPPTPVPPAPPPITICPDGQFLRGGVCVSQPPTHRNCDSLVTRLGEVNAHLSALSARSADLQRQLGAPGLSAGHRTSLNNSLRIIGEQTRNQASAASALSNDLARCRAS